MKKLGALSLGVLLTVTLAFGAFAGVASAKKPGTGSGGVTAATVPVDGTLADGTGAVDGTLAIDRFTTSGGDLVAVGTFTGTVTDAFGAVTSGTQQIAVPVDLQQTAGSCEILDLVLGPLDLNLLGLEVHLDTVHLNITAQQGPGNLLGNLLCAVAGLLDGNVPAGGLVGLLTQLSTLLNQILSILG
jgi:hypothetical protein